MRPAGRTKNKKGQGKIPRPLRIFLRIVFNCYLPSPQVINGCKPQKRHEKNHSPLRKGGDGPDGSGIDDQGVFPQTRAAVWSVAVTVNVNVPAVVGVPAITPPVVIGDSPVGSDPAVMVNVYGPAPPLAVIVWL